MWYFTCRQGSEKLIHLLRNQFIFLWTLHEIRNYHTSSFASNTSAFKFSWLSSTSNNWCFFISHFSHSCLSGWSSASCSRFSKKSLYSLIISDCKSIIADCSLIVAACCSMTFYKRKIQLYSHIEKFGRYFNIQLTYLCILDYTPSYRYAKTNRLYST